MSWKGLGFAAVLLAIVLGAAICGRDPDPGQYETPDTWN